MASEYWGDGSEGYNSKIPIQTILTYIKSKYGARYSSISYGDLSATINFGFDKNKTIRNPYFSFWIMFFSFKKQSEPIFINTNPSSDDLIQDIHNLFEIQNIKNITFSFKGGLDFKHLSDDEMNETKRQNKIKDKLGNF